MNQGLGGQATEFYDAFFVYGETSYVQAYRPISLNSSTYMNVIENKAALLKGGELIAVRGEGKFFYQGEEKTSRKGRLFVKVLIYH